jgi:hypothetical protein
MIKIFRVLIYTVTVMVTACAGESATQSASEPPAAQATGATELAVRRPPRPRRTNSNRPASTLPAVAPAAIAAEDAAATGSPIAPVYSVVADGTVGCASAQALKVLKSLREMDGASPRVMAQAHRDGECMTVFRVSKWNAEEIGTDMLKLRLINPQSQQRSRYLYFFRNEVILSSP